MPNYTENLRLEKPLVTEQYNISVFNANADKIDQFAGQVPARSLTADELTTGAKINGVNFKGDSDVVTGAGFYYDTVIYADGDLAFIYNQNDDLELHKSLVDGNVGHNPLTSTGYWEKVDMGGATRNIGEIVASTIPLTDAGLHLLNGTRLSGDGIYKEFVEYIAELVSTYPDLFTTESNWQSTVTQYEVCGKFVYDSVNNTVRLPNVTGFVEGARGTATLGDLTEAGLPNIIGTLVNVGGKNTMSASGAFTFSKTGEDYWNSTNTGDYGTFSLDASDSNDIYGNSNTVQPQSVKVLYYIVVATTTKTNIEVDIDEVVTDLNGKADVDLSNATPAISFATAMNTAGIRTVVETYVNGDSWYRVYSDKWCEQGGFSNTNESYPRTIDLIKKPYSNTNYNISVSNHCATAYQIYAANINNSDKTVNSFKVWNNGNGYNFYWRTAGYLA